MVRSWRQASPYGELTVLVSDAGLSEISLPGDDQPDVEITEPDPAVARQLDDWFAGNRRAFELDLDLRGVEGFRLVVLETLAREVRWGEVVTYGELAALAGRTARPGPSAARCVAIRSRS